METQRHITSASRYGMPEDIAELSKLLISDPVEFITGIDTFVDVGFFYQTVKARAKAKQE